LDDLRIGLGIKSYVVRLESLCDGLTVVESVDVAKGSWLMEEDCGWRGAMAFL
jgi:hypothetical protein